MHTRTRMQAQDNQNNPVVAKMDERIQSYIVRAKNLTVAYSLPEYFVVRGAQEFTVKYEGAFPSQHWYVFFADDSQRPPSA